VELPVIRRPLSHFGFAMDNNGTVAIIFTFAILVFAIVVGLAVDGGRAVISKSEGAAALDAAALASARYLMESSPSDAQVNQMAIAYFNKNSAANNRTRATFDQLKVQINRCNNTITMSAQTHVPTTFGRLAGVTSINFTTSSAATFDVRNIELGLQIDLTGSMCDNPPGPSNPCSSGVKLDALKTATNNLIDIILPPGGTLNKARIGLAPFTEGVNAGTYASTVSGGASTSTGCVFESPNIANMSVAPTDAPPGGGNYFFGPNNPILSAQLTQTPSVYSYIYCPSSPIVPLTSDANALKSAVSGFQAANGTAGHLGTSWAWYLISPNWASIWPGNSKPVAYNSPRTIKAVLLMTDGDYNFFEGHGAGGQVAYTTPQAANSRQRAIDTCNAMKAQGVVVYAVFFSQNFLNLEPPAAMTIAENTLAQCASNPSDFIVATDGAALNAAFTQIAQELNDLRLAQ
jgi:Flp pilus assembly protein TadG